MLNFLLEKEFKQIFRNAFIILKAKAYDFSLITLSFFIYNQSLIVNY